MANPNLGQAAFAQLGSIYNDITNEVTGGVTQQNQQQLIGQVTAVQAGVNALIKAGAFADGATLVHAQNIADQMNFLEQQIGQFGTNAYNPKFINDVVRDVQDIVAGDNNLAAMAAPTHGFQQVSNLLTPPAPFADSGAQTTTLNNFITDSNSLAARAQAAVGMDPNSATVKTLVSDIQHFSTAADAYSTSQGGLFSARFNNEFTLNGVQGTASKELIAGLQKDDAALVNGAADVLIQNAADVQGNMLSSGATPATPAPNGGIPASIQDVHTAGVVFNDAATKLIGGVGITNQASVVNDLNATKAGLQAAIGAQHLTGQALADANTVIGLLGHEAGLVQGINTANPTPVSQVNGQIGADQAQILNTVNHDATLTQLAAGGFAPEPQGTNPFVAQVAGGIGQAINGIGDHTAAATPATPATPAVPGVTPATPATPAVPASVAQAATQQTTGVANTAAMANAAPAANAPAAANPAPAAGDHLAAMVDAAMANLASPPAAMVAAAAGANTPAAANPVPAALSPSSPAAADHAAIDMAHHSLLDNNHISTAHDQLHHIWG